MLLSLTRRLGAPILGRHATTREVRCMSSRIAGTRPLRVLAVESSADDACAAIVTSDREILANVVNKQHHINKKYGGIHPIKAQETHMVDVPRAIGSALAAAKLKLEDLDAIAYTRGPGMNGCLSVGATAAKTLAAVSGKPLVGVHHMQAHALTALLTETSPPGFPFLTLLVSGGHTQLVLAESMDKYSILVTTMDNAIGDAFDKVARMLHLPASPTSGLGPVLEEYAAQPPLPPYDSDPITLGVPLTRNREKDTMAYSYSGLLSATERKIASFHPPYMHVPAPIKLQRAVSRAFQAAAVSHITDKTRKAMAALDFPVHGFVVSGGVGSNKYLRQQLQAMLDESGGHVPLFYPPVYLCTDNAAMIAWTAILRLQNGLVGESLDLPIRKKWSLEDLYDDVPETAYRQ